MDVETVPSLVVDGLWHKTGNEAMSRCDGTYCSLHSNDLIGE